MTGRIKSNKLQRSAMPLPEAGRIKIGDKKISAKTQKEYPVSLDYFRATGTFANHFHKIFGDRPDKITIVFINDDIAASCNEEFACWENGKRWGYGDGDNFTVWDESKKEYVQVTKDSPLLKGKQWDIMLTLRFVIPEMKGILGHWVFSTKGSKTTIPSIVQAFDFVKERVGTVAGVPFELVVEKTKGYSPGEAKQYSKVKLVPCFSEQYMEKVRAFLSQGKSLSELAPLMVSEAKLLEASSTDVPQITMHTDVIEVAPVEHSSSESNPSTLFDNQGNLKGGN